MLPDFASQTQEFNKVWENRNQPPFVLDNWVNNDWAKGRTQYLTFLARVRDKQIHEKVSQIQQKLAEFPCVEPFKADYLHVTVKEISCFLVDEKKNSDEYTKSELDQVSEKAGKIIQRYEPFTVNLERLNNFTSVICVEGHDGGVIRGMNAELREELDLPVLQYDSRFLPHMSITQYTSEEQYRELISYLEEIRDTEVGIIHVDKIQLVIAHLPVTGRIPRIEVLHEYPLKG